MSLLLRYVLSRALALGCSVFFFGSFVRSFVRWLEQGIFSVEPIDLTEWLCVLILAFPVILIDEFMKVLIRFYGTYRPSPSTSSSSSSSRQFLALMLMTFRLSGASCREPPVQQAPRGQEATISAALARARLHYKTTAPPQHTHTPTTDCNKCTNQRSELAPPPAGPKWQRRERRQDGGRERLREIGRCSNSRKLAGAAGGVRIITRLCCAAAAVLLSLSLLRCLLLSFSLSRSLARHHLCRYLVLVVRRGPPISLPSTAHSLSCTPYWSVSRSNLSRLPFWWWLL